jgi:hypothetical protein
LQVASSSPLAIAVPNRVVLSFTKTTTQLGNTHMLSSVDHGGRISK